MQVGDLIAGRFRLEAQAGAGGMGVVFRARDLQASEQWVAVKAWRNEASAQPERFLREAGALAQLREPAVVGHVQHGVSEAGEPYLAMDWIDGPTLCERLEAGGLTPLETIELAARVLRGLAALHAAGIVHRDLKPSNLMLPGGQARAVRILDLGVARLADASELTLAGTRLGTPRYMAPEQIRDPRHVDGRADVFALGCIVFECLCGQPAFGGADPIAVMAQILFGAPPPASELRAELPEALDQLLSRLLARRRELRPEAGPALQAELRALSASRQLQSLLAPARLPPSASVFATIAAAETQAAVSFERTSSPALFGRPRRASYAAGDTCPSTPLVGRARELNELALWMQDTRAFTLWGGAGVGKTRLAHELSRLSVSRLIVPPEGVLFCELARARDSRDVARLAAEQLGASAGQSDAEDQLGWLFAKLGPLLLVLDRAEHLTRELEPLIRLWTQHAPELRVLVTSRVRLRSTREYELGPLPHRARGQALAGAAPAPLTAAGELVLSLARRILPESPAATPEQADAIASALDGNPLAIELALARLPLLGFQGVVERLHEPLELLSERGSATTMRRAIAWSWELLAPAERAAFMQCSVFAGAFSLRAAEAVIALPDGAGSTLDAVQSLREQSLLGVRGQAGAMRLSMPAAVREFAAERLAEHAELAGASERHAEYCAQSADPIEPEDLVAAAEHSLSAGANPARAVACVLALEPQLSAAGVGGRLSALLTRAIEASTGRPADLPLLRARQLRGRLLAPAGELLRARRELQEVLREAEPLGDAALHGTTLLDLGVTHHFARELSEARAYYERALDVLCEVDAPVAEARCYGNLGAVAHDRARLAEAAEGYRRALALLPELGQERLVANFESNLALVEHELGRTARARALYASAASRLESLLDARLLGIALGNFGSLALAERVYAEAHQHFVRAEALLAQSGDRRSEGLSLARLGACFALMERLPEAEQRAVRAERLLRKDPQGRAVAALLSAFGDVQSARRALADQQLTAAAASAERAEAKRAAALPLREQSDDLRLYLALLEPQLTELTQQLTAAATVPA